MRGVGTLINVVAILLGSSLGIFAGHRLSERIRETIMQGLGLATLAIGIVGLEPLYDQDAGLRRFVILIIAMILGGIVGEALRLEDRLTSLGERLQRRFGGRKAEDTLPGSQDSDAELSRGNFVEGLVVASTVYTVGALTILGAVEDGLGISIRLLAIKSTLDGIASVGFASVYGWGVAASVIPLVIYQMFFTIGAAGIEPLLTDEVVAQLSATGTLLVIGIGLRLLDIAQLRIVSLLPALLFAPLIAGFYEAFA